MAELDRKKTIKNLKKKGFDDAANKEDGHNHLVLFYEGRWVLTTKVSHSGNIENSLIGLMSRQCKLSTKQFLDLARCPMSKDEYFEILEESGILD